MPKYYFQVSEQPAPDIEGVDLPDLDSARLVALRTACAIIAQAADDFWQKREWQMTVADESGLALFSLTFFATDAAATAPVEIHVGPPPKT